MTELSPEQLGTIRLRAQCLNKSLHREALVDVVRDTGGIQAQSMPAAMLALRARIPGLTSTDIEEALSVQHTIVRIWAMRGTLHLLTSEDVGWMIGLLGPMLAPRGKRRRLQLGLDENILERGMNAIREILGGGRSLTRYEIVDELAATGILLDPRSQGPIHLISYAALMGLVCHGPDRPNNEPTYTLITEWIGSSPLHSKDEALSRLAERYFAGYGPAALQDFAAWSGLSMKYARFGLVGAQDARSIVNVQAADREMWLPPEHQDVSHDTRTVHVNLLPAFDPYVLGYANRDEVVRPEHQSRVYHGGQTVPVVLVNGLAEGVWRYKKQAKKATITVEPFTGFERDVQKLVMLEIEDIGRFWEVPVEVSCGRT